MAIINPYLNFDGKTEEAFNFYKSVLGGEFTTFQRFKDTPGIEGLTAADGEKMMHVALPIGKNTLMGTDVLESQGHKYILGNHCNLSLNVESKEEADRLFNGLSAGGKITMPLADVPWGYFGMWDDKFGIHWMVNYDQPKK